MGMEAKIFFEVCPHQQENLLLFEWAILQTLLEEVPHAFQFGATDDLDESGEVGQPQFVAR